MIKEPGKNNRTGIERGLEAVDRRKMALGNARERDRSLEFTTSLTRSSGQANANAVQAWCVCVDGAAGNHKPRLPEEETILKERFSLLLPVAIKHGHIFLGHVFPKMKTRHCREQLFIDNGLSFNFFYLYLLL